MSWCMETRYWRSLTEPKVGLIEWQTSALDCSAIFSVSQRDVPPRSLCPCLFSRSELSYFEFRFSTLRARRVHGDPCSHHENLPVVDYSKYCYHQLGACQLIHRLYSEELCATIIRRCICGRSSFIVFPQKDWSQSSHLEYAPYPQAQDIEQSRANLCSNFRTEPHAQRIAARS